MPYIAAYMYLQNSDEIFLYLQNAVKYGYNDGVKRGLRWQFDGKRYVYMLELTCTS